MVHCNETRGGKKDLVASFQLRGFPLFSFSKAGMERGGMMDFTGSQVETASLLGSERVCDASHCTSAT